MYKVLGVGEEMLRSFLLSDGFSKEVAFRSVLSERGHFDYQYIPLVPVKGTDGIQNSSNMFNEMHVSVSERKLLFDSLCPQA